MLILPFLTDIDQSDNAGDAPPEPTALAEAEKQQDVDGINQSPALVSVPVGANKPVDRQGSDLSSGASNDETQSAVMGEDIYLCQLDMEQMD